MREILWLCLLLASLAGAAAHVAGLTGHAVVTLQDRTLRYRLTLPLEAVAAQEGLAARVADRLAVTANGQACTAVPGAVVPPAPDRASLTVTVDFACPAAPRLLGLRDDLADIFGGDYHTLTTLDLPGGRQTQVLEPDRRELQVALAAEAGEDQAPLAGGGLLAFFRYGLEHILTGFDHLLFLLALLLRGGGIGALLGIVTAFTLAHSITLGLAVLRIAALPAGIVEPLIALSIAWVAAENILARRPARRRWVEGFAFGLVHGFGFAGALLELDLPAGALAGALLFFNLGVEAGQAAVVALLFPLLLWLRRDEARGAWATALSACVLVAGLALLIERVLLAAA
ncbi:HupE/UreJ family protein [Paracraurococcus lichenis]|uniref:HupE/UreJ family protein n=1 Tax=Paracraurococcus lichenis TaxID=3064888 RepID=A0ABT9DTB8_9PROT|nr:HupE/UreJ family protein [Paracraurococcus sp. LOR1-02]MDO9707118.1 HupE/UreJ family protein [Paracraurococcus sp. LOR1-02]